MRPRLLVLPAVGALVLGTAVPASAVVTVSGSTVTGDAGANTIAVTCAAGRLTATGAAAPGDLCVDLSVISVEAGAGNDTVNLSAVTPAAFPGLIATLVRTAGDGSPDTVVGSPFYDVLTGDFADTINGEGGNDTIAGAGTASGGPGDDTFRSVELRATGGEGDDRFIDTIPTAGIDGGPGTDTWEFDLDAVLAQPMPSVVTVTDTEVSLAIGSSSPYTRPATSVERVRLTLLRHDTDTYEGSGFGGDAYVRGLAGVDTLVGGRGNDVLLGDSGNDVLTGNAGIDVLDAGDGDDQVFARDGLADRIDCGAGTDSAVADAVDSVVNCETVQLPVVVPPPAPVVPETSAVKGKKSYAKPVVAKFGFSSPTAGATFQCKLDKGRWKACTSKLKVKTKKLSVGKHKVRVRAVLNGVVDPTPSVRKFKVTR